MAAAIAGTDGFDGECSAGENGKSTVPYFDGTYAPNYKALELD